MTQRPNLPIPPIHQRGSQISGHVWAIGLAIGLVFLFWFSRAYAILETLVFVSIAEPVSAVVVDQTITLVSPRPGRVRAARPQYWSTQSIFELTLDGRTVLLPERHQSCTDPSGGGCYQSTGSSPRKTVLYHPFFGSVRENAPGPIWADQWKQLIIASFSASPFFIAALIFFSMRKEYNAKRQFQLSKYAMPQRLHRPNPKGKDDLTKIKGIGPGLEARLNDLGFFHYHQIASWTAAEIAWVEDNHCYGFKGRVTRDDWTSQAKRMAAED